MKLSLFLSSLVFLSHSSSTGAYSIPATPKRVIQMTSYWGSYESPSSSSSKVSTSSTNSSSSSSASTSSNSYEFATDATLLNYALTLEQIQVAFYTQGLKIFSQDAFAKAGFAPAVRAKYEQILSHEKSHVALLQEALQSLGESAVQECVYDFGDSIDVPSFIVMSTGLETVGASAYSGALNLLTDKEFLLATAAILSTEARHSTWIQSKVLQINPWSGPYEVPLTPNQAITIASQFVVACPDSNPSIAARPFPSLNLVSSIAPGVEAEMSFNISEVNEAAQGTIDVSKLSAAFLTANGTIFAPLMAGLGSPPGTFNVTFPAQKQLLGTGFVAIVNNDTTEVTDATIVAGPMPIMFPFNATDPAVESLFSYS
ncbi:hypothetical protein D9757_010164 [Collybiopsis confluens]|uniref:Uncharacterized protein n=1 Tax=Collybiopsis confluens TaxID=2823264 RepID=A0A8H5LYT5_9AGAR|nr:hypothetical protein D9757_010164 [Collybiopsis confluens]